jgi:hypothetical protein
MPTLSGLVQRKADISDASNGSAGESVSGQGFGQRAKMKLLISGSRQEE